MVMIFEHCAKIPGSISGGAKDETPPKFLYSTPPNESTGFKAKRIDLVFDEYLQLKDVNSQFYSSPPIKKKPEILLYSKTVRTTLKEPLLPDITYTFDYGESIVDNNEGNKLTGFTYVFSTGDHIDSLTLTGRVLNAFDLKPRAKDDKTATWVLLYNDLSDSVVYKATPTYIARTDHMGFFTLSHIRPDTFLIFAIRDMGNNLKFDMPSERIAFSDTLIVMAQRYYHNPEEPFFNSRTVPDSLKEQNPGLLHEDIVLFQFEETPTKQFRTAYERKDANMLRFAYTIPVDLDSIHIHIVEDEPTGKWYELETSKNNDTLDYWLTDTSLVNRKILLVDLLSPRTDSLNRLVYVHDTLKMTYEPPKQATERKSRRERKEEENKPKPRTPVEMMLITSNIKSGGVMDLTSRLQLIASQPITDVDPSKIILQELVDTLKKPVAFKFAKDSINSRKGYIDWKLKEDTKYTLIIDTLSFKSIYGVYNDSTGFNFSTQRMDHYSSIEITFDSISGPLIVQAVKGDKEDVVKQVLLTEGNIALIDYLNPDKYVLKVIHDRNGNGKWDTGHYLEKIQPEKVEYYPESEVETQSNFKTEIRWSLKRNDSGEKENVKGRDKIVDKDKDTDKDKKGGNTSGNRQPSKK